MRTFIAIDLPEGIKNSLAQLQDKLKAAGADVKWVEPKNIHLTLKFLGEVDDKKLQEIVKILEGVAKNNSAFAAGISSLGAFPKTNYPRVIWVGIGRGDEQTKQIANALEEKISKIGIPAEDRPFSSHITIGRLRSGLNRQQLVQALQNMITAPEAQAKEFPVTKITLFKSTLTPGGPIYEAVKEVSLATN